MDIRDINMNQELGNRSDISCETKHDKNHTNTNNYLDETLKRRIDKYKVGDDRSPETIRSRHSSREREQSPSVKRPDRAFHNICLGPGAYDNLTFKDDNGQFDLKKFVINGQSKMCSKSKALHHKSFENLLMKNSHEQNGNSPQHTYEKANRASASKTITPTPSRRSSPPASETTNTNGSLSNGHSAGTNPAIRTVSSTGSVPDITQTAVQIPADGNIQAFTADEMAAFFRHMKIDEFIVQRLKRKKLDGKKFSRLKDTDLEEIGINNPIVCYFRDRSRKQRIAFML